MRNRRNFGYAVDIKEGKCDNTDTGFDFTAVAQILFTSGGGTTGYVWAGAQAFSSNFVTLSGEAFPDGTIADGPS